MLIGVAGPVANFILAFALMVFYYGWVNEVPAVEVKTTTVEWVIPARRPRRQASSPATLSAASPATTIPTGTDVQSH